MLVVLAALVLAVPLIGAPGDLVDDDRESVHLKSDLARDQRDLVHALATDTRRRVEELLARIGLSQKSTGLTRLRVYAAEADFEQRRRATTSVHHQWAAAFFDAANNEVVTCWQGGTDAGRRALRHELTHLVLREHAKNPPLWFDEGLAEYIGSRQHDAFGDVLVTVDRSHLETLRSAFAANRICPLYQLMELKEIEFYGRAGTKKLPWDRSITYAESWSLVYFLLHATAAEDRDFLQLVVQRLESGSSSQSAFKKHLADLDERWRELVRRDDLIRLDAVTFAARRSLDYGDLARALASAKLAIELDPGRRAAWRVVAEVHFKQGRFADAARACEHLLEGHDQDLAAHLCRARAFLSLAREMNEPSYALQAIADGLRAAELSPLGARHEGLIIALDAQEARGDLKGALQTCRKALAMEALPDDVKQALAEREWQLMHKATR